MKATVIAVLLAVGMGAAHAQTKPDRQLVLDYLSAAGVQEGFQSKMAALGQQIKAGAPADQAEKIDQALASTVGWPALEGEFVALIQGIYTADELTAMTALVRSPSGKAQLEKDERFIMGMWAVMQKRVRSLLEMMPVNVTMDAPPSPRIEGKGNTHMFMYAVPPQPVYPLASRARGEQGVVLLSVVISPKGEVEAVGLRKSSGFPALDEAALAALAQAKYKSVPGSGTPVRSRLPASITFDLKDAEEANE